MTQITAARRLGRAGADNREPRTHQTLDRLQGLGTHRCAIRQEEHAITHPARKDQFTVLHPRGA